MGSSTSKTASSSSSDSITSSFHSPPEFRAFSFPMPSIHHPPSKKGDTDHIVSLTSSTYGSLRLDEATNSSDSTQTLPHISISQENKKITPETEKSRDTSSPDSVINTWELMTGLDDNDTCKRNGSALKLEDSYEFLRLEDDEEDWIPLSHKPKQPLWKHLSEESFLSELDHNIISSYKRALSKNSNNSHKPTKSPTCSPSISQTLEPETVDNKNKIVLYFTSLRGIRKTYEDCSSVRTILRSFQVAVEERDISMDFNYRKELQITLGEEKPVSLPQVFIKGIHIGGYEEIKRLNEGGELGEMLKGFPVCESVGACESCGDARFVLCSNCGGSTKVFEEEEDGFKRCSGCNENGLVRCNKCCV